MTKQELNRKVNEILEQNRESTENDWRMRYLSAMENPIFKEAELAKRRCDTAIAEASANSDYEAVNMLCAELPRLTKLRNDIIKENNYDLELHPVCTKCGDQGYVNEKECVCRKKIYDELLRKSCGMANLPVFTFEDNEFDAIRQPQAPHMRKLYDLLRRFCANFAATPIRTILLSGSVGIGKSCLACACAWELMKQGFDVLYLTAFDFGNVLLSRHLGKQDSRSALFDDILDTDFLVIDDLGTEPIYRNVTLEYLFSIINSRITAGKKTMIVSNLDAEQFVSRYGQRTLSRLADKSHAIAPRYIEGTDLRLVPRN